MKKDYLNTQYEEYLGSMVGQKVCFADPFNLDDGEKQYYFAGPNPDGKKGQWGKPSFLLLERHSFSISWEEMAKTNLSLDKVGWPTIKQLKYLYNLQIGEFHPRIYWSCEEESMETARGFNFANGKILSGSKLSHCLVRPIKLLTINEYRNKSRWFFFKESWD